jgi:hypothetical protein
VTATKETVQRQDKSASKSSLAQEYDPFITAPVKPERLADNRRNMTASDVLALQRAIGNRSTERLLRQSPLPEAAASHSEAFISSVPGGLSDTIQLMPIDPLPSMKSQWTFGLGLFFDPNCGWYCQVAALDYWVKKKKIELPDPAVLAPKTTKMGYGPLKEGMRLTRKVADPGSIDKWEGLLPVLGPIIVGGNFGLGGTIGHYLLIVGVDQASNTFEYLNPSSASKVHTKDFDWMIKHMDMDDISAIDPKRLDEVLKASQQLEAENK